MHVAVVGLVVAQTGPALWASDAVETAGDVLEAVLPAAAAGVGLWRKDWDGLLHFGYSLTRQGLRPARHSMLWNSSSASDALPV
jgi:hypothetical protein